MSKSIAVVGAGIVGVATAEWLRRDGHQVTLIDRVAPGGRDQTSFGNAGILARCAIVPVPTPGIITKAPKMLFDPDQPLFLKWQHLPKLLPWLVPYLATSKQARVREIVMGLAHLNLDTVDQHLALARGTPAEAFIRTGNYNYLYRDRAAFDADGFGWALRREHGIVGEAIEGGGVREWDDQVSLNYRFLYSLPDHGQIKNPGGYVKALFDWFIGQGGKFIGGEVADLSAEGTVVAAGETYSFDKVVVCLGVFTDKLTAKLGIKAHMEAERGYHLLLEGASHQPPEPVMVADAKYVASPMDMGLRLAGVVEFGGKDRTLSKAPIELLKRSIMALYPNLTWSNEVPWLGHRPATIDSLPLLGAHPTYKNIYFAAGHQHVGLTGAPKTGRIIADMIAGKTSNVDLSAFAVDRFS